MATNRKEKAVLFSSYLLSIFLLIKFVPKDKIRHATVPFLSKQVITWLFGLIVVEKKLIEYPYRLIFKDTYKGSFCFEYFLYPVFCVLYNLYYPDTKARWIKMIYNFIHTTILASCEALIVKYTKLIRYRKWNIYMSFISMGLSNYVSHRFYKWFFK